MTEVVPPEPTIPQAGTAMTNGSAQSPSANGQRPPASDVVMKTANTVIQELFSVGLDLSACAEMVPGRADDRLAKAVDRLDAVIAHIRTAIFDHLPALDTSGSYPLGDGTEGGIRELVEELGSLAGRIDALAQSALVRHTGIVGFLDAAHYLHRARISLAADLDPPAHSQDEIHLPTQAGLDGQTTNANRRPTALADGRALDWQGIRLPDRRETIASPWSVDADGDPTSAVRHPFHERDRAAVRRDEAAEARDRAAHHRDQAAGLRDQAASLRDEIAQHRQCSGTHVRQLHGADSDDRPEFAWVGMWAGSDRSASALDREASAMDRAAAKADRHAAAADRAVAREILKEASLDGLTGAYVRHAGLREMERDVSRARRAGEPLTVVFIDVDRLKEVNDGHGHSAGDRLLQDVVQELQKALRPHDLVIRYGGDEFVCAMSVMTRAEVTSRLGSVRKTLAERSEGYGSITFGVTELNAEDTVEELVARADREFYAERKRRASNM